MADKQNTNDAKVFCAFPTLHQLYMEGQLDRKIDTCKYNRIYVDKLRHPVVNEGLSIEMAY